MGPKLHSCIPKILSYDLSLTAQSISDIEEYLDHTSCEEPHNLLTTAKDMKMAHMEMFFGTMPSHTDLGMISC
jgi:hypothetical protein